MNYGFPEYTDSFLSGQDIFYTQFNKISFYVEDDEQEHLYFNILKRLFYDVDFQKIFPLKGKTKLKEHAIINTGDKTKIYIADIDFDDILGVKEELDNVFYLDKYSIENYFIDKQGLYEVIREKNPKLKDSDIDNLLDLNLRLKECKLLLTELTCTFLIIQKYSLGQKYFGLNCPRDFNFDISPPTYKNTFLIDYFNQIEMVLKEQDGRYTLKSKQKEFKKFFRSLNSALNNIPGKYLLNTLKYLLDRENLIHKLTLESFTYKLSKECDISSLHNLRDEITEYRS